MVSYYNIKMYGTFARGLKWDIWPLSSIFLIIDSKNCILVYNHTFLKCGIKLYTCTEQIT